MSTTTPRHSSNRPLLRTRPAIIMLTLIAAAASTLAGGPLNPPAGPVTATGKTTQEVFDKVATVEPRIAINNINTPGNFYGNYEITAPGSYYLESNLGQGSNTTCIAIGASNVTIDLNGFSLIGNGSGFGTGMRVYTNSVSNITVTNGAVTRFVNSGIDFVNTDPTRVTVRNVRITDNGAGLKAANGVDIEDCLVEGNTSDGITAGDSAVIRNCQSRGNSGAGIAVANACTVQSCSASSNTGVGISASTGSQIDSCSTFNNTGIGIATSNALLIRGCTATSNAGGGISALTGTSIQGCSALGNHNFGISVINQCNLLNNTCTNNPAGATNVGIGILVTGSGNRIEANLCTGTVRGLNITGAFNWVGRNTTSGNTGANYVIAAGNAVAPIIIMPNNGSAISGSSYTPATPGGVTTTDPNTNFAY